MVRLRKSASIEVLDELPDGSLLVHALPSQKAKSERPGVQPLKGRLIAYQHPGGEPAELFVTLLDWKKFPAATPVELYHSRWEIEIAYDELKTHLLERKECLRSKKPEGVKQEIWGLLLLYNLVRREMLLGAAEHGVPPARLSFRSSLLWIRTFWLTSWTGAPGNIPKHLGKLRSTMDVLILPPRRSERRYPRHVKIKMSNYKRSRGKRSSPKENSPN